MLVVVVGVGEAAVDMTGQPLRVAVSRDVAGSKKVDAGWGDKGSRERTGSVRERSSRELGGLKRA